MSFLNIVFDELEKVAKDERLPEETRRQIVDLACRRAKSFSKIARNLGIAPDELADRLVAAYARNTKAVLERYNVKNAAAGAGTILGGVGMLTVMNYIIKHIKNLLKAPATIAALSAERTRDFDEELADIAELELQAKQLDTLTEDLADRKRKKRRE